MCLCRIVIRMNLNIYMGDYETLWSSEPLDVPRNLCASLDEPSWKVDLELWTIDASDLTAG